MKICCFGQNDFYDEKEDIEKFWEFRESLRILIESLIRHNHAREFVVGRHGEFNRLFADVVRELKERYPHLQLTLAEPFPSRSVALYKDYYDLLYDRVTVPPLLVQRRLKNATACRDRWVVEGCDVIITYVNARAGRAYKALCYAQRLGKLVINLGCV